MPRTHFGTDGVRGIVGEKITPELVERLGKAAALWSGRGRVFGVLNMLVSVASILPIIIVGPISDLVGTTAVIIAVSILVLLSGLVSILRRGRTKPEEAHRTAGEMVPGTAVDPIGVAIRPAPPSADRPEARR